MTDILTHEGQAILFDDWEVLEKELSFADYNAWKEKRQADQHHCLFYVVTELPGKGKVKITRVPCDEPDCPICGPKIREEMQKYLSARLAKRPLRLVKLTGTLEEQQKARAKILRKYSKKKVFVSPNDILTEKGTELETEILIDTTDEIGEEYTTLSDDDIMRWSQKSFQAKKSGSLHKSSKPQVVVKFGEVDEDFFDAENIITYEQWQTDCDNLKLLKEIEREVLEETRSLDPKTFKEVGIGLEIRRKVRRRLYEKNKIVILSNKRLKCTLKLSEIDWQGG